MAEKIYISWLTQRRIPLMGFLLQALFVFLTFPLSIPILLFHAWFTRNSVRFWETKAQHFARQLKKLAAPGASHPVVDDPTSSSTKRLSMLTLPTPASSSTADDSPEADVGNVGYRTGATGLPRLYEKQCNITVGPPEGDTPGIPPVIRLSLCYEIQSSSPAAQLAQGMMSREEFDTLTSENPDIDIQKNLFRCPTIHLFTFVPATRQFYPEAQGTPIHRTPPLALSATTDDPRAAASDSATPAAASSVASDPTTTPSSYSSRFFRLPACFKKIACALQRKPEPKKERDFTDLLRVGAWDEALPKATNNHEVVQVLEGCIDSCGFWYEDEKRRGNKDPSSQKSLKGWWKALTESVNQLPDRYWLLSGKVQHAEDCFYHTVTLLKNNSIDAAFKEFQQIKITPFFTYACPHIIAWQGQLRALFRLLRRPRDFTECAYPNFGGAAISVTQMTFIKHFPTLARYFDEYAVQPFKALTDEWSELEKKALVAIGDKFEPGRVTYPELPKDETTASIAATSSDASETPPRPGSPGAR